MTEATKAVVVPWEKPARGTFKGLRVLNSLTREKTDFVPHEGNRVAWYICGPTVYDSSHMGHARSYLSFDIIRRILEDYLHYDVFSVMNITDVDDKIIKRARHHHLLDQFAGAHPTVTPELLATLTAAGNEYNFDARIATHTGKTDTESVAKLELETARRAAFDGAMAAARAESGAPSTTLLGAVRDVLGPYLDAREGAAVTDHSIFTKLSLHYEAEYNRDMAALGVRPPHVLTRVSEYVPEIVKYVEKIIENGFAYESQGSVYFDTIAFGGAGHQYCKLSRAGNTAGMQEAEGELSQNNATEKRNRNDFALWKKSRPGEPSWPSPWGGGRPGWHIECSVMASEILGLNVDIHGGGEDLKFPHHDNELAQAEAYYGHHQWVNYFLHAGHLHIKGAKMSKSLKNFLTIGDALRTYTARQVRLLFLISPWEGGLDFNESSMSYVQDIERGLKEFFMNVVARQQAEADDIARSQKWTEHDRNLQREFEASIQKVDAAIKDSFDTPGAMRELQEIVRHVNLYLKNVPSPKALLLREIANFVNRILTVFGVVPDGAFGLVPRVAGGEEGAEQTQGILNALRTFRDGVRAHARGGALVAGELLRQCDDLRDGVLPELGVRLEDQETGPAVIKLDDKNVLLREREEKRRAKEERLAKESERKARAAAEQARKDELARVSPRDMFNKPEEYSKWDDEGKPTHDAEGKELSKSQSKKIKAAWDKQVKTHQQYLERMLLEKQEEFSRMS